jgi:hypothetical protein
MSKKKKIRSLRYFENSAINTGQEYYDTQRVNRNENNSARRFKTMKRTQLNISPRENQTYDICSVETTVRVLVIKLQEK